MAIFQPGVVDEADNRRSGEAIGVYEYQPNSAGLRLNQQVSKIANPA
jgi:hypothetical protein